MSISTLRRALGEMARPDATAEPTIAALRSLGWPTTALRVQESRQGTQSVLASLAERPALLVVTGKQERRPPIGMAYSSEAPFAISLNGESAILHETVRWQEAPGDSPLAEEDAGDTAAMANVFALLTPDTLAKTPPSETLGIKGRLNADLAGTLGSALSLLRQRMALPDSETKLSRERDLEVLRFFHQLLFIRFHEDRRKVRQERRLEAIWTSSTPSQTLEALVSDYSRDWESELFTSPALKPLEIPQDVLRSTLKSMIEPWKDLQLDFKLTPSDVAGRLYESYLAQVPAMHDDENALFPVIGTTDSRSKQGSFYTPVNVANRLTEASISEWLAEHQPERFESIRIVDPACGSGAFLLAAYRRLREYFEDKKGAALDQDERKNLLSTSIFGADLDESALMLAQVQLYEEADLGEHSRLPEMGRNLLHGDSLLSPPGEANRGGVVWDSVLAASGGRFDLVLANPPFGAQITHSATSTLEYRDLLRQIYPESRAWGADLAYYFLDLARRLVAEGGRIGFVFPRKVLTGAASKARGILRKMGVVRIEDYRGCHLFPNVAAYVSLVVAGACPEACTLTEAKDSRLPADLVLDSYESAQWTRTMKIPQASLGKAASWSAFELRLSHLLSGITQEWEPLGKANDIKVVSGTQTGDNRRFVLEFKDGSPDLNIDGVLLPWAATMRWVRATGILPFRLVSNANVRVLLPSRPMPGYEEQTSKALAKLGGLPKHVQPGKVDEWRKPKVVLRAFGRELSAAVDPDGDAISPKGTAGAFAIVPHGDSAILEGMAAYLQSAFAQWVLRGIGEPRHDETVELLEGPLRRLPWPTLQLDEWAELARCHDSILLTLDLDEPSARSAAWWKERAKLDELVFDMLGADSDLRDLIYSETFRIG